MPRTIGIIGGKGKMGRAFATFFDQHGFNILISDKGTKLTNKKIVQKSDIVFVTVSLTQSEKVLKEIIPHIAKGKALVEITSVKDPLIPYFTKCKGEVLSLHPMCNDTQFGPGSRMLFMPYKGVKTAKLFKKLFTDAKFILQELKVEKHDTLMSLIQGLPHFAEISFAHTMQELGFKTKQLSKYSSSATDLKLKMVGRILAQNPALYGGIQLYNPRNLKTLKAHMDSTQKLYEIIENQDLKGFETFFTSAAKSLGTYKDEALQETDHVLSILRQESLIDSHVEPQKKTKKAKKTKKTSPKNTLVLLGPEYTYTDFAADKFLARTKKKQTKVYTNTIEEVFIDVEKGRALYGMVPVENRLHGTVREALDGLFTHKVQIVAEVTLPITHCISMLPGVKPKDIKIIMSHGQALQQCQKYLKKHFPKADHVAVSSSAKAFMTVKNKNFRHIAVIGPEKSACHYGLKPHAKNIADDADNFTKFIVIQKRTQKGFTGLKPIAKNPKKTSIAFYFSKDKAGSLFTVFEVFAENKVNMTKVESRPYKQDYGNYLFFIDFEGNLTQAKVKKTLKAVQDIVAELKVLGTY